MFFIIFLTLAIAFCILSGAYWNLAKGTPSAEAHAGKLQIVGGRTLALPYLELVANLLRDRSLALFCLLHRECNACCLPPGLMWKAKCVLLQYLRVVDIFSPNFSFSRFPRPDPRLRYFAHHQAG